MLAAGYDGEESKQQATFNYLSYRWRREMSASYQQFRATPLSVIRRDMEYINLERKIEKAKSANA